MSDLVWLASYPKSGNTWLRLLIENLDPGKDVPADINKVIVPMTGDRAHFDILTLIDSTLMTADEIDALRPAVLDMVARGEFGDWWVELRVGGANGARIVKVHDAYTHVAPGRPLLGAAARAVVVVRDPRAVTPSFAHHRGKSIDQTISDMARHSMCLGAGANQGKRQLRQRLLSWSAHVLSWLEQTDMPIHLVRYEDLKADAAGALIKAMAFIGHPVSTEAAERAARLTDFSDLQAQEQAHGFRERPREHDASFFRRGESEGWRDELSAAQIGRIEAAHGDMMRRLGYVLSEGSQPSAPGVARARG